MKLREVLLEHMIAHLLDLCKQELELDMLPPIRLINDQPTIDGGNSFGEFSKSGIDVVTTNRHPIDIMRTLAHELVHWKQSKSGMVLDGSDGSPTENQANAVAGIIMRRFSQMYPQFFINVIPK